MMKNWVGFRCSSCHSEYGPDEVTYTCPKDQANLDVVLATNYLKSQGDPKEIISSSESSSGVIFLYYRLAILVIIIPLSVLQAGRQFIGVEIYLINLVYTKYG